ncbi:MAG: hypothetical protein ACJ72N_03340 [Labedaea sp.]
MTVREDEFSESVERYRRELVRHHRMLGSLAGSNCCRPTRGPPRIPRDVLHRSAQQAAELLDTGVASVTSVPQRAWSTMRRHDGHGLARRPGRSR